MKEETIEIYIKSAIRKRILKMSQGEIIDKMIQEYIGMAIDEGALRVLNTLLIHY